MSSNFLSSVVARRYSRTPHALKGVSLILVWVLAAFVPFVIYTIIRSLVTGRADGPYRGFSYPADRRKQPILYWFYIVCQFTVLFYSGSFLTLELSPALTLPWLPDYHRFSG